MLGLLSFFCIRLLDFGQGGVGGGFSLLMEVVVDQLRAAGSPLVLAPDVDPLWSRLQTATAPGGVRSAQEWQQRLLYVMASYALFGEGVPWYWQVSSRQSSTLLLSADLALGGGDGCCVGSLAWLLLLVAAVLGRFCQQHPPL